MVDDAVDHGGGDGLVAEDAAPSTERQVAGEDQRGVFVAAGDELEEQVGTGRTRKTTKSRTLQPEPPRCFWRLGLVSHPVGRRRFRAA